jgi:hypothetical protein
MRLVSQVPRQCERLDVADRFPKHALIPIAMLGDCVIDHDLRHLSGLQGTSVLHIFLENYGVYGLDRVRGGEKRSSDYRNCVRLNYKAPESENQISQWAFIPAGV